MNTNIRLLVLTLTLAVFQYSNAQTMVSKKVVLDADTGLTLLGDYYDGDKNTRCYLSDNESETIKLLSDNCQTFCEAFNPSASSLVFVVKPGDNSMCTNQYLSSLESKGFDRYVIRECQCQ